MKNKVLILLTFLFFISGCSKDDKVVMSSKEYNQYTTTYDLIKKQSTFLETSSIYDIEVEVIEAENNKILYYVIIDSPQISMFDVEAMAIIENQENSDIMHPSIGILEDKEYNLIPTQVNPDEGYVEGIVLSGEAEETDFTLNIMVSWIPSNGGERIREFIQYVNGVE